MSNSTQSGATTGRGSAQGGITIDLGNGYSVSFNTNSQRYADGSIPGFALVDESTELGKKLADNAAAGVAASFNASTGVISWTGVMGGAGDGTTTTSGARNSIGAISCTGSHCGSIAPVSKADAQKAIDALQYSSAQSVERGVLLLVDGRVVTGSAAGRGEIGEFDWDFFVALDDVLVMAHTHLAGEGPGLSGHTATQLNEGPSTVDQAAMYQTGKPQIVVAPYVTTQLYRGTDGDHVQVISGDPNRLPSDLSRQNIIVDPQ